MCNSRMSDLVVLAEQQPGIVSFSNYSEVKMILEEGLKPYKNMTYSIEDMSFAKDAKDRLNSVKKKLDAKKKELKEAYEKPYIDVEAQLDELISMVKEPLKVVDDFIKSAEKEAKKLAIYEYAQKQASVLGSHASKVLESPSFFNAKWLNATCRDKEWHDAIDTIIRQSSDDINTIQSVGGDHKSVLLARYYETLSLEGSKEFLESIRTDDICDNTLVEDEDNVIGYKVLKVYGTERQMLQLMTQFELQGLEVEELEDGMPKAMKELEEPTFDSFVAFDIEHTGTFGIAKGDADPEIIEIGAVKVKDGVIVERFDELANPGRKIVPMVSNLTHITDDMVADKPNVDEVIRRFKDFAGDDILIGHNIKGCDIPHITRVAKRAGISFDNAYLDTKKLAMKLKDKNGWDKINLTELSKYYDVKQNDAHRAWCDAEANAYVYLKMKGDES